MRRIVVVLLVVALAVLASGLFLWPTPGGDPSPESRGAAVGDPPGTPHLRGTAPPDADADAKDEGAEGTVAPAPIPPWPVGAIEPGEPGSGRVFVLLVDAGGNPLPHHPLEVSWWKAFGVHGETVGRTDEDGRFATEANEPWEIESVSMPTAVDLEMPASANLEEWPDPRHEGPFLARPGRPEEVVIVLPRTGILRGRVVDREGTPQWDQVIVRRRHELDPTPFRHRLGLGEPFTETDDDGTFAFLLVEGSYELTLDGSDTPLTHHALVTIDETHRRAVVELRVAKPVAGRTLGVTIRGLPEERLPRVSMYAYSDDAAFEAPPASEGVTYVPAPQRRVSTQVEPGLYRIEGLTGDDWKLYTWEESSGGGTWPVPPGATEMTVTLESKPSQVEQAIRLVGVLPNGMAVCPTMQVRRDGDLAGSGFSSFPLDGQDGVPVHLHANTPVYVVLYDAGTAFAAVGPLHAGDTPERVQVPLEPARDGTVSFLDAEGRGVFCEVRLRPAWALFREVDPTGETRPSTREGFAPCTFDTHRKYTEDGCATFSQLGSTPYEVLVRPANATLLPARGILRGGETLTLRPGDGLKERVTLHGRVIDEATRAGVEGADVRATATRTNLALGVVEAVTHPDGRFTLAGLPPGAIEVRARRHGYAFHRPLMLTLDSASAPLEIALEPRRWVSIRVLDADGRALVKKRIEVRRPDGTLVVFQDRAGASEGEFTVTDVNGRADLGGVPAGILLVRVMLAEDTEPRDFPIDVRQPPDRLITLRVPR